MSTNDLPEPTNSTRISLQQPETGYRYNEDSFHLLKIIKRVRRGARIADIGAGSGVLSLSLSARFPYSKITAVEIQTDMCDFLVRNIKDNGMTDRVNIVNCDYRKLPAEMNGSFDLVVSNPPYRTVSSGKISTDASKASSRHQIDGDISDLCRCAFKLMKDRGDFYVVYLAEGLVELIQAMTTNRIEPKELVALHPSANKCAKVVLVRGVRRAGRGITIRPPITTGKSVCPGTSIIIEQMHGLK